MPDLCYNTVHVQYQMISPVYSNTNCIADEIKQEQFTDQHFPFAINRVFWTPSLPDISTRMLTDLDDYETNLWKVIANISQRKISVRYDLFLPTPSHKNNGRQIRTKCTPSLGNDKVNIYVNPQFGLGSFLQCLCYCLPSLCGLLLATGISKAQCIFSSQTHLKCVR